MEASGLPAIADDSGLCVDALNGAPGVYSARYGGPGLDDVGRYRLCWRTCGGQLDRRCRFVSAICCCFPNGDRVEAGGVSRHLGLRPQGEDGFGYDPIFFVPALKRPLRSSLRRRRTPSPTGECAHGLSGEAGAVSEQVKCLPAGGQIKRRPVYGRTDKQAAGPAQGSGQQH